MASDEKHMLVLQGGGALGAYQAGAYEALCDAGIVPNWVAGISIGSVNGAIIAGNKPDQRVARLRSFWRKVSSGLPCKLPGNTDSRAAFNEVSAAVVATFGIPGFFAPRFPPAVMMPPGAMGAISVYDTTPLRTTLNEVVDFDVLNNGEIRFSAGAVEVLTGNFAYFDTAERTLAVDHVMASAALPPGFPPVEIDGRFYWDGGLVSNTPLQQVMERGDQSDDACVFQVDLFSAKGAMPRTLFEVAQREKEIRYSSRTRLNTDRVAERQKLRKALRNLLKKLPPELRDDPDAQLLNHNGHERAVTIVHLIHRRAAYERHSMDYEFSRLSMEEHWEAGRADVQHTLGHKAWRERVRKPGVTVLDLTRDEDRKGATS